MLQLSKDTEEMRNIFLKTITILGGNLWYFTVQV